MADRDQPPLPPARRPRRRRAPVTVLVGRRSAWLSGAGVATVLDEVSVPHMWCPIRKQLTVPIARLDDVLAVLEWRDGRTLTLEAVDPP